MSIGDIMVVTCGLSIMVYYHVTILYCVGGPLKQAEMKAEFMYIAQGFTRSHTLVNDWCFIGVLAVPGMFYNNWPYRHPPFLAEIMEDE